MRLSATNVTRERIRPKHVSPVDEIETLFRTASRIVAVKNGVLMVGDLVNGKHDARRPSRLADRVIA